MIRRVRYQDIDFEKYRFCLENSAQKNFYAQKEILDQLSGNWEILVLNDYEAVMPVHLKKKFGLNIVIMPLFCQQLGIFSTVDDPAINQHFYQFLNGKYRVFNYSFNENNRFETKIRLKKNYIIDRSEYKALRKSYFKGRKSTVKTAQNHSFLELDYDDSIREYISKFRKGLDKEGDYRLFLNYLQFLNNKKMLLLCGSFLEEELTSLAVVVETENELFLLALINNTEMKDHNGASYLIDQIIQKNIPLKSVNFMGSSIRGIEIFFKSFGAGNRPFPVIQNSVRQLLF